MKAGFKISASTVNGLIEKLDIKLVSFLECLVSPECRLVVRESEAPSIYYVVEGAGLIYFRGDPPIAVGPHTVIIAPPNYSFRLETCGPNPPDEFLEVEGLAPIDRESSLRTFSVGIRNPKIIIFSLFFRTLYCKSMGLFETLSEPIIEEFKADDRLDMKLRSVMAEMVSHEVAADAMTSALLKEIIVILFRRSLGSVTYWGRRISLLSDPQVALAVANMVEQPGKAHSIHSLAKDACLGRSTFVTRFHNTVGQSPMVLLRELRMQQAAMQLQMSNLPVEQILRNAGYAGRSSFVRAFRASYGVDPSTYRDLRLAESTI